MAQWMEGQRSGENASALIQEYAAGRCCRWPTGRQLDAHEVRLARYAYAWALANVEYIVQKDGMVTSTASWTASDPECPRRRR